MDDTRDIAIRADEASASAHHRLNGYNGQIQRLGDEQKKMRQELNRALFGDGDGRGGLVPEIVELKTTVRNALRIAAALVSLVIAIAAGVTVYALTHARSNSNSPPQQAARTQQQH